MALTDPVPLRLSTEWSQYPAVYPLPVVYGAITLHPQPYDDSGALWLLAGHPVQGVDGVSIDGQQTDGYALQNGVDDTGQPVGVLEIANPVDSRDKITVSVRGKQHSETGLLLNRPDLVLFDWLVNVCGLDYQVSDFDDLRTWAQNNSVIVGGVIDEVASIQIVTDGMAQGMGLAWGADIPGVAIPWPPANIAQGARGLNLRNTDALKSTAQSTDIVTALNYRYSTSWTDKKPRRSMRLEANSIDQYGRHERDLDAGWLQSAAAAEEHAVRWLGWNGCAVWDIEADTSEIVQIGEPVNIYHPYCNAGRAIVTSVAGTQLKKTITAQVSELASGEILVVSRSSGVDLDAKSQTNYIYADGKLTYTVTDEAGKPIVRASVTLDGTTQRYTDNAGQVQFTVGRGSHTLTIEAPGFLDQTVTVTL